MLILSLSSAVGLATQQDWPVEALDGKGDQIVCGLFGDPHVTHTDGRMVNHLGSGEYQVLSLPKLSAEVHYFGCGIKPGARPWGGRAHCG